MPAPALPRAYADGSALGGDTAAFDAAFADRLRVVKVRVRDATRACSPRLVVSDLRWLSRERPGVSRACATLTALPGTLHV